MIRQSFIILLLVFSCIHSYSQAYFYNDRYFDSDLLWEGGISMGIMNALTDVGEKKGSGFSPGYYDWKLSKLNTGIYFGVLYKNMMEARLELVKGKVAGDDSHSNSRFNKSRNLSYQSKIFELTLIGTFHPIMLLNTETIPDFSPYVMAGIGMFSFYPETQYNGEWVALRRLNTEGQNSSLYPDRKQYSLRSIDFPFGFGLRYEYNAKFNFHLEGLFRFTSTDYLDDVSTTYVNRSIFPTEMQKVLSHRYTELTPNLNNTGKKRGTETNNDKFFSINLKVGYVIGRQRIPGNPAR